MIQLWSGPRWSQASVLLAVCDGILEASASLRLDQTHDLAMRVAPDAAWLQMVTPRCSLWMPDLLPEQPEWRLRSRTRTLAGDEAQSWIGMAAYLGDLGPVTAMTPGGREISSLRGVNLSARNYVATWVIPHLRRRGVDWISVGETDTQSQYDLAWEGISARELLDQIAEGAGCEWWLRPTAQGYAVDVVPRVGAGAGVVWVTETVDLLALSVEQPRDRLVTVVRPMGRPAQAGEPSRATIEQASWRVEEIDGSMVRLRAHRGGAGPILEDGQFGGAIEGVAPHGYGVHWGSTVAEILGSEAPDRLNLSTVAGLVVGMDVMIVRRSQTGAALPLTEIPSPAGIAVSGVIVAPVDLETGGGRNWAPNPMLRGVAGTRVDVGRRPAALLSSTRLVTDLPPDTTWPADAQVGFAGPGGVVVPAQVFGVHRLTSSATSDAAGEALLELSQETADTADSLPPVYILPPVSPPPGWVLDTVPSALGRPIVQYVDATPRPDLAASVVGPHDFAATAPYVPRRVTLAGLAAGDRIYPGDRIIGASGGGMMALEEIEVPMPPPSGSPPAVMADAVAYWRFAAWDGVGPYVPDGSGNGHHAWLPGGGADPVRRGGGLGPGLYFDRARLRVPHHPDLDLAGDHTIVAVIRGPVPGSSWGPVVAKLLWTGGAYPGYMLLAREDRVRYEIGGTWTASLLVDQMESVGVTLRTVAALRESGEGITVVGATGSATVAGDRATANSRDLFIGAAEVVWDGYVPYLGTILGIGLWPRLLSAGEIADAAEWMAEVPAAEVAVTVADPTGVVPSWADGTAVTVRRPPVPWVGRRSMAVWAAERSDLNVLRGPTIQLPFARPGQTLRARAVWALGGWHATTWLTDASTSTQMHAPVVRIRRMDTSVVVASSTLSTLSVAAGQWQRTTLTASWVLPDPVPAVRIEIVLPGGTTASGGRQRWQALPLLLAASLDYGDPDLPVIEGSEATDAWLAATERLRYSRAWSGAYQGSRIDLAARLGLDPASPALALGGTVRLRAGSLGIDEALRVRGVSIPDVLQRDARVEEILLEQDPVRISRAATLRAGGPLYISADGQPAIATTSPPPTPGVLGAMVAQGAEAPTTYDPLPLEPL